MSLTREDAERIEELILAGRLLSNMAWNISQGGTTPAAIGGEMRKRWEAALDEARPALAKLKECEPAFDRALIGC
ncbi:MAG TPA: hypothetical protein VNQ76_15265 [Planctomicrobium sp.]|nr:hypothetical protein [Planctomicrobium sp.]